MAARRLAKTIFLPNWYIKMVKPGKVLPKDQVQFHVPMDMAKPDIRKYLERIYNVKVARVNTRIQIGKSGWKTIGSNQKHGKRVRVKKKKDIKVAYVTLADQTFVFPDFYSKTLAQLKEEHPQRTDSHATDNQATKA